MREIWKDVPGYEGYYQASNFGRVKRLERVLYRDNGWSKQAKYHIPEKIKEIQTQTQGYSQVVLYKDGIGKTIRLNTLIARMFIPPIENKPYVNHIDGNKQNNRVDNLEWCTASENVRHAYNNGLLVHYHRPVIQINKDGYIVNEFSSIKEAAKYVGGSKGWICNACKRKNKLAYGYLWRYKYE